MNPTSSTSHSQALKISHRLENCHTLEALTGCANDFVSQFGIGHLTRFCGAYATLFHSKKCKTTDLTMTEVATLQKICDRMQELMPRLNGKAISNALNFLAKTKIHPRGKVIKELAERALCIRDQLTNTDIVYSVQALKYFGCSPEHTAPLIERFCLSKEPSQPHYTAMLLDYFRNFPCNSPHIQPLVHLAFKQRKEASPESLITFISAIGALANFLPKKTVDDYLKTWCLDLKSTLGRLPCSYLSRLLLGLATAEVYPEDLVNELIAALSSKVKELHQEGVYPEQMRWLFRSLGSFYEFVKRINKDSQHLGAIRAIVKMLCDKIIANAQEYGPYVFAKAGKCLAQMDWCHAPFFVSVRSMKMFQGEQFTLTALASLAKSHFLLGMEETSHLIEPMEETAASLQAQKLPLCISAYKKQLNPFSYSALEKKAAIQILKKLSATDQYAPKTIAHLISRVEAMGDYQEHELRTCLLYLKKFIPHNPHLKEEIQRIKQMYAKVHIQQIKEESLLHQIHSDAVPNQNASLNATHESDCLSAIEIQQDNIRVLFKDALKRFKAKPTKEVWQILADCFALDPKDKYLAWILHLLPELVEADEVNRDPSWLFDRVANLLQIDPLPIHPISQKGLRNLIAEKICTHKESSKRDLASKLWKKHIGTPYAIGMVEEIFFKQLPKADFRTAFDIYRIIRHHNGFSIAEKARAAGALHLTAPDKKRKLVYIFFRSHMDLLDIEEREDVLIRLSQGAKTAEHAEWIQTMWKEWCIKNPTVDKDPLLYKELLDGLFTRPRNEDPLGTVGLCNFYSRIISRSHVRKTQRIHYLSELITRLPAVLDEAEQQAVFELLKKLGAYPPKEWSALFLKLSSPPLSKEGLWNLFVKYEKRGFGENHQEYHIACWVKALEFLCSTSACKKILMPNSAFLRVLQNEAPAQWAAIGTQCAVQCLKFFNEESEDRICDSVTVLNLIMLRRGIHKILFDLNEPPPLELDEHLMVLLEGLEDPYFVNELIGCYYTIFIYAANEQYELNQPILSKLLETIAGLDPEEFESQCPIATDLLSGLFNLPFLAIVDPLAKLKLVLSILTLQRENYNVADLAVELFDSALPQTPLFQPYLSEDVPAVLLRLEEVLKAFPQSEEIMDLFDRTKYKASCYTAAQIKV